MKTGEVHTQARFRALFADLVHSRPRLCALTFVLSMLLPFLSGFSVMLLVPILRNSAMVSKSTASGTVDTLVSEGFAVFGVQPSVNNALLVFLAVSCLHAGLVFYQLQLTSRLRLEYALSKQKRLHRAVGRSHWAFFLHTRPQDIAHALSIEFERLTKGLKSLMALMSSLALAAVYILFSFYLSDDVNHEHSVGWTCHRPVHDAIRPFGTQFGRRNDGAFAAILSRDD